MLISTKELRTYLQNVGQKCKASNPMLDSATVDYCLTVILRDMAGWEQEQLTELEPPSGLGVDAEQALIVYCGPKLYAFVEKFNIESEEDISVIAIGKIYLEVKKALKEGRFKRV